MGNSNAMGFILSTVSSLVLAFFLSGCGSGKNSANPTQSEAQSPPVESTSPLLVSLTDAEGDFLRYEVAVSAINLTRANGAKVSVLARKASVDFSQYVELSELLTILETPVGRYESASITLDYSEAEILVQSPDGQVLSALAITPEGETIKQITVDIEFGDSDGFAIVPGVARHLALDFDLDESNQIQYTPGGANVVVSPALYIDSAHAQAKPMRIRGLLTEVNEDDSSFKLALRPFRIRQFAMGQGSVYVSENTHFEIDGAAVEPSLGLESLNELGIGAAVVVMGRWQVESKKYLATQVFAGSSVPWGEADIASGVVVARNASELTLRAVTIELVNAQFQFYNTLNVHLDEATKVIRVGEGTANIQQISVGSNITVTGNLNNGIFNAEQGLVRISPTTLSGTVVDENELALDLHLLNGLRPDSYEFSGTGYTAEEDADQNHYQVDRLWLNLESVAINEPLRVRGWIAKFGEAPADIIATTIIDNSEVTAHLNVDLNASLIAGSPIAIDDNQLLLNLDAVDGESRMIKAGIPVAVAAQSLNIQAHGKKGVYSLIAGKRLRVYSDFGRFSAAVAFAQDQGMHATKLRAHGFFDQRGDIMNIYRCRITLETSE